MRIQNGGVTKPPIIPTVCNFILCVVVFLCLPFSSWLLGNVESMLSNVPEKNNG